MNTSINDTSQIGEILLLGVEKILGRSDLDAVLNLAQLPAGGYLIPDEKIHRMKFTDISALTLALENKYGTRGGRGIALRAGRESFNHILRQKGEDIGITGLSFRLLPVPARLKTGLDALAGWMGTVGDEQVDIIESEQNWTWRTRHCALCWQRTSIEPVCHFTVGMLQEFSSWASGGRVFSVHEIECKAAGAASCLFHITKKALD